MTRSCGEKVAFEESTDLAEFQLAAQLLAIEAGMPVDAVEEDEGA